MRGRTYTNSEIESFMRKIEYSAMRTISGSIVDSRKEFSSPKKMKRISAVPLAHNVIAFGGICPEWTCALCTTFRAMSTQCPKSLISLCLPSSVGRVDWRFVSLTTPAILIAFCYPPCSIHSGGYHHCGSPDLGSWLSGVASTPACMCLCVSIQLAAFHVKHICINYRCDVFNREQNNL